jgi:large subunit ribosomal protein L5
MADRPRLRLKYDQDVQPALMEQFAYANVWQAPRLVKVCVNMGVEDAIKAPETLDKAVQELSRIIGQRPAITRAKKSVANFHIRKGMPIGCRATLRGARMWEFADRLISLALPRIRDFRGLSPDGFDGRGNYSLGLTDLLIFPELGYDDVDKTRGMDITIVTTAPTDEEAEALIRGLGLPLKPRA